MKALIKPYPMNQFEIGYGGTKVVFYYNIRKSFSLAELKLSRLLTYVNHITR
jgi:hypothetical protein